MKDSPASGPPDAVGGAEGAAVPWEPAVVEGASS